MAVEGGCGLGTSLLIITGSYRRMGNREIFAKDIALRIHTYTDHIANLRLTDLTLKPCISASTWKIAAGSVMTCISSSKRCKHMVLSSTLRAGSNPRFWNIAPKGNTLACCVKPIKTLVYGLRKSRSAG
jgi:hypothetical protein